MKSNHFCVDRTERRNLALLFVLVVILAIMLPFDAFAADNDGVSSLVAGVIKAGDGEDENTDEGVLDESSTYEELTVYCGGHYYIAYEYDMHGAEPHFEYSDALPFDYHECVQPYGHATNLLNCDFVPQEIGDAEVTVVDDSGNVLKMFVIHVLPLSLGLSYDEVTLCKGSYIWTSLTTEGVGALSHSDPEGLSILLRTEETSLLEEYDGWEIYSSSLNYSVHGTEIGDYVVNYYWNSEDKPYYIATYHVVDHDYVAEVTDPTCTEAGYTTRTCSRCGDSFTESEVPAIGHAWSSEYSADIPATCTEEGSESIHCSVCGASQEGSSRVVPKVEHQWGEWEVVLQPAYGAEGSKRRACSACGAVEAEPIPALVRPDGWNKIDGEWYYYSGGEAVTNAWKKDSRGWVYLGKNGAMVTEKWVMDSVGWCYVGKDGYAVKSQWKRDSKGWCYLDEKCRLAIGWKKISGKWYWFDDKGRMAEDKWVKDSKGWVYLGKNGAMATDKWVMDSVGWCYVGSDGYAVRSQWKDDSVGRCYLDEKCRLAIGWKDIDGKTYWFDSNGRMATGERMIDGVAYTFGDDGALIEKRNTLQVGTIAPQLRESKPTASFIAS